MCGLPDLEGACRAGAILAAGSGEVIQAADLALSFRCVRDQFLVVS
jgi:hypothetical protein